VWKAGTSDYHSAMVCVPDLVDKDCLALVALLKPCVPNLSKS